MAEVKISAHQRKRFSNAMAIFGMGYKAGRVAPATLALSNMDCAGCASDELRKFLGFDCREWRALCGPQGVDCPTIACSEPESE